MRLFLLRPLLGSPLVHNSADNHVPSTYPPWIQSHTAFLQPDLTEFPAPAVDQTPKFTSLSLIVKWNPSYFPNWGSSLQAAATAALHNTFGCIRSFTSSAFSSLMHKIFRPFTLQFIPSWFTDDQEFQKKFTKNPSKKNSWQNKSQ